MLFMEKDSWYSDRILWKAKQHNLLDKKCCKFSDLSTEQTDAIAEVFPEDIKPIIVFWESQNKWTVLGARAICSFYDGKFVLSSLDEINKQVSLFHSPNIESKDVKSKSSFISLGNDEKLIWAPAGSELFALMNILQMFPLAKKNSA